MMEKQMNIPSLRFPEFVGEWEKKKLGEVAEKTNSGKTPLGGESVYTSQGIIFIRSQNVTDDKLDLTNLTFIPEEINIGMKNSIVKANDVLLNITGASLGRSCVVPSDFKTGNVNQHVCIIRLKRDSNPRFIQPIFSSTKGQNIFKSLQTGSGREGLNFESIKGIKLSFPTYIEQTKIANFLTAVDEKIQILKKKKDLLEQYKKGVMQKLFSQEIRFNDDDGNEFPAWEVKKLGEVSVKIGDGLHGTPIYDEHSEIYFINGNNLINGKIQITDKTKKVSFEIFNKNDKKLNHKTLLISLNGTIGNIAKYNNEKVMLGKSVGYFNFKDDNDFYYHILNSETVQNHFVSELTGSTIKNLSLKTLRETIISLPSLPEQTKIANFLSAIDEKIKHNRDQIEKMEIWKKGLLQRMFV